jgi:hypothetical protein
MLFGPSIEVDNIGVEECEFGKEIVCTFEVFIIGVINFCIFGFVEYTYNINNSK